MTVNFFYIVIQLIQHIFSNMKLLSQCFHFFLEHGSHTKMFFSSQSDY